MEAKLHVVEGAKPAVIRLKLPTIIGRGGSATLTIKSSKISRRHCEISVFEGELTVRDLGSSNGTFVNGHRISDVTYLSPGDQLTIGPLTLRADYEVANPIAAPTSDSKADGAATDGQVGDAQVVDDSPPSKPESEISSVIHYQESADGSFLGIEEITKSDAPDGAEAGGKDAATSKPSQHVDLDINQDQTKPVDPGDSQLNKFFEGLS